MILRAHLAAELCISGPRKMPITRSPSKERISPPRARMILDEQVRKLLKDKSMTTEKLTEQINKDSQLNLTIKDGKFAKGDNELVDSVKWVKGLSPDISKNGQVVFVDIKEIITPESKSLEEAKGLVTADYQNDLEKTWIEQLRKKYPYQVNEQVLSTVGK